MLLGLPLEDPGDQTRPWIHLNLDLATTMVQGLIWTSGNRFVVGYPCSSGYDNHTIPISQQCMPMMDHIIELHGE